MHMPTARTPEAKVLHAAFLAQWARDMGHASLKGRSVFVRFVDEACSPPVNRSQTLVLLDKADLLVTRQRRLLPDGARRLKIQRWLVAHMDPHGNRVCTSTFPPAPNECEREELVTLEKFSLAEPLGTSRPLWEHIAPATVTFGSLDTEQIPTHRLVPDGPSLHAFRTGLYSQIKGFARSRDERLFHAALDFPKRHLRMLSGLCSSRLRAKHLGEQLSGRICTQAVAVDQVAQSAKPDDKPKKSDDERAVASAVRLAKAGYVGKAARVLATEPVPDMASEELYAQLLALHPAGSPPTACVPPTAPLPFVTDFEVEVARTTARLMRSGCSPGPTAWTEELLFQALGHDDLAKELCAMLSYIANGLPSPDLRERLTRCWIVAIPKQGGGVRPIAIGETFLKVASALAMRYCSQDLGDLFGDVQFGIARPGGAEEIVHRTRCFVRASRNSEVVVTLDFSNAFNSPSRESLWRAVRTDVPRLTGIFCVEYGQPSSLLFRPTGQSISSERGTRQGSVCGPAFFCILLQQVLDEFAGLPGLTIYAYMDDVTIHARDAAMARMAVGRIVEFAHKHGMRLNPSKCEWLSSAPPPPNDDLFLRFKRPAVIRVLGASIATTAELEARHLDEGYVERRRHNTFFRRLLDVHGPQGMAILTRCGVPRATYMCRTHEFDVVRPVIARFDADVLKAATAIFGGEISPSVRAWLHLPARTYGGLGLRQMSAVARTAYAASRDEALLGRAEERTQQARMAVLDTHTAQRLSLTEVAPWLARAREEDGRAGGFASDHSLSVAFDIYSAALRGRYGVPVRGTPATVNCPGCNASMSAADFTAHGKFCSQIPGDNRNHAHAVLGKAFDAILAAAGAIFTPREVREFGTTTCPACTVAVKSSEWSAHARTCRRLSAEERRHIPRCHGPDRKYQLSWNGSTTVIDFTIVYEQATSHRGKTLQRCFDQAEARKHAAYSEDCVKAGYNLIVGAVASTGLLSTEFAEELRRIASVGSLHPQTILRRMSAAAVVAAGGSLLNAERAMNLAPPRQYRRMEHPQTIAVALHRRQAPVTVFRPSEPLDIGTSVADTTRFDPAALPISRRAADHLADEADDAHQALRDLHEAFWCDLHHQAAVVRRSLRASLSNRSSSSAPAIRNAGSRRPSSVDTRRLPRPALATFRGEIRSPSPAAVLVPSPRSTRSTRQSASSSRPASPDRSRATSSPASERPSATSQQSAPSAIGGARPVGTIVPRAAATAPPLQPTASRLATAQLHRIVQDASPPADRAEPQPTAFLGPPTDLPSSQTATSRIQPVVTTYRRAEHGPLTRAKQAALDLRQQQPHAAVASART